MSTVREAWLPARGDRLVWKLLAARSAQAAAPSLHGLR